jgi:hypothetical protein
VPGAVGTNQKAPDLQICPLWIPPPASGPRRYFAVLETLGTLRIYLANSAKS